jgi:hypothetical protein
MQNFFDYLLQPSDDTPDNTPNYPVYGSMADKGITGMGAGMGDYLGPALGAGMDLSTPYSANLTPPVRAISEADVQLKPKSQAAQTQTKNATAGTGKYTPGEFASDAAIESYIRAAASKRGIDPDVAVRIAQHEGGTDERAKQGTFSTGKSWWPFQLHYGGAGTPYASYGNTAGMGNDFTERTGYQPGDPNAMEASVDYALDHAARYGWGAWYGRGPAGVGEWDGIPGR